LIHPDEDGTGPSSRDDSSFQTYENFTGRWYMTQKHKWAFRPRFNRHAFGWRSALPIKRIKEAVSEIKKVARREEVLAADGVVIFLEKISPAIELVDSSSGAIGNAVNKAIEDLIPIIAGAPAEDARRDKWLVRLWQAVENDHVPYIESLEEYWGELCVTPERASWWADEFINPVRLNWSRDSGRGRHFKGIIACLSCLLRAGRYEEILELVDLVPYKFWPYRVWAVRALKNMGEPGRALKYAEESRGLNDNPHAIARECENILLSKGMMDEAFERYAYEANVRSTYLATFRAIAKKYPHKDKEEIIIHLAAQIPGEEGKWFAAARAAGLYSKAIELAMSSPCDPRTLTRAARDTVEAEPVFAMDAGFAALYWLVEGYGYDITSLDVWAAYNLTMQAAENCGKKAETLERIRELVRNEAFGERFVYKILNHELGLA
jgi:hypothetical protein